MVEKPMKTLAAGEVKYIITDAEARGNIEEIKSNLQYSISQTDLPKAATAYPFNFIAGHKYRLTVVGTGVTSFYRFFTTNNGRLQAKLIISVRLKMVKRLLNWKRLRTLRTSGKVHILKVAFLLH